MDDVSRRTILGGIAAGAATAALSGLPASAGPNRAVPSNARPSDDRAAWLDDRMSTPQAWASFLAAADLIWRRLPTTWYEGPFLGNGFLGAGVYAPPGSALRFTVQHSQVQDHRPEFGSLFGLARLPIGYLTLELAGAITGIDWRLDLWNAQLIGTITTTAGSVRLRAFVHSTRSVLVVDVTPSDGESDFAWNFHAHEAVSPRADPVFNKPPPAGYTANPDPVFSARGDVNLVSQALLAGGGHATAWREVTCDTARTIYAAVAWSFPGDTAADSAHRAVSAASAAPLAIFERDHVAWWHGYYRKSFLSIPDGRLQSFYWIQLYKVASAARRDAPVMATCGPWLEPTPWPATWWNLNVQLEYWLIHGSNHLELDAITRALSQHRQNLVDQVHAAYRDDSAGIPRTTDMALMNGAGTGTAGFAVGIPGQDPPTPEVGNLTWALHNVWLSYRHTMDPRILRDVVYPLLRRAINYYRHFLFTGEDGRLHLPATFSPEYGVDAVDTNYDLALIRWGAGTLLEAAAVLQIADPLIPAWQELLARLVDYPVDGNGFLIGAGVPFAKSHRHYSHMLAVYPLYLVHWEQPAQQDLIARSLQHWISFAGALQGYSYTGAASMSAQMRRGADAAFYLSELLRLFIQPNTMYKESGPVIETPLSAAQSLHDMLCQSWGGVIRVFPAVPPAWPDVTLHDFRTQGAFLVTAVRRHGATAWVRVRSEAGSPCVLRTTIAAPLAVRGRAGQQVTWRQISAEDIAIDLPPGDEALVYPAGTEPDLTVAAVATDAAARWGLP